MDMTCPHCGNHLRSKPEWAGRTATCKSCNGRFVIPTSPTLKDDEVQFEVVQSSVSSKPLARPAEPDENPFEFLTQGTNGAPSGECAPAAKRPHRKFSLPTILGTCLLALLVGVAAIVVALRSTVENRQQVENTTGSKDSRSIGQAKPSTPAASGLKSSGIPVGPQATESHLLYVQSLQAWYDPRPERTVFLGRTGARNMKDAISWAERYLVAIDDDGWDGTRIFLAIPAWRVIWKNDQFDEAKGQTILSRAATVTPEIAHWQTALMPHNGGETVPNEIAITLVCDIDGLFIGNNYQADRGRTMQQRLQAMPVERPRDLGNVLWVADPHAAMLLAQYAPLFSSSGQINETVYSTVLSELKVRCPKHSPRSK